MVCGRSRAGPLLHERRLRDGGDGGERTPHGGAGGAPRPGERGGPDAISELRPGSGKRIRLDDVSAFDGDIEAIASFSIVHDRWILQRVDATGPTIEPHGGYYVLRDGRNGHWLYDNDACTETTTAVEVLADGHLAVACDRLLLFTPDDGTAQDLAQEQGQDVAPAGAKVRDLRVDADGTTLQWTQVVDGRRVSAEHRVG